MKKYLQKRKKDKHLYYLMIMLILEYNDEFKKLNIILYMIHIIYFIYRNMNNIIDLLNNV